MALAVQGLVVGTMHFELRSWQRQREDLRTARVLSGQVVYARFISAQPAGLFANGGPDSFTLVVRPRGTVSRFSGQPERVVFHYSGQDAQRMAVDPSYVVGASVQWRQSFRPGDEGLFEAYSPSCFRWASDTLNWIAESYDRISGCLRSRRQERRRREAAEIHWDPSGQRSAPASCRP